MHSTVLALSEFRYFVHSDEINEKKPAPHEYCGLGLPEILVHFEKICFSFFFFCFLKYYTIFFTCL